MLKQFFVFIFLFIGLISYAQRSTELVKIDGVKYYVHTVEKGHTLYAISKVYSVDIDDLIASNPGVENGLSIGQEVLIPKSDIKKKEAKRNPPQLLDGKLIHTVSTSETLYGIAAKYSVSIEDLENQNPQVKDGLKVGMQLIINQSTIEAIKQEEIKPALPDDYIEHQVTEKETLYSISKTYDIGIDSIVSINPSLVDGLKVGMILYIPKTQVEYIQQQKDEGLIYSGEYKETYNIALFLPFNLVETDTLILEHKVRMKPLEFSQNTLLAVEFYNGFMMAVDSLRKQGLSVNIFAYDLGNNREDAEQYLSDTSLLKMDLLVGPFHYSTFQMMADFAHQNGIKIICPIDHPNRILLNRPEVIESTPSQFTQIRFLVDYLLVEQENYRTIAVSADEATSQIIIDDFKKYAFQKSLHFKHLLLNPSFKPAKDEINPQYQYLFNALDSTKINRIFIASINDGFIVPLFNLMNEIDTGKYKIQVFGLDKLFSSDQINSFYRHKYNLTLVRTHFVDYNHLKTFTFINEYRKLFNTDPSSSGFAMMGFDNGYYFLKQMLDYGLHFEMVFVDEVGLQMKFKFKKINEESGFENQDMFIVQYVDFNLVSLPVVTNFTNNSKPDTEFKNQEKLDLEVESSDQ